MENRTCHLQMLTRASLTPANANIHLRFSPPAPLVDDALLIDILPTNGRGVEGEGEFGDYDESPASEPPDGTSLKTATPCE